MSNHLSLNRLSIQQRLTFLICTLLLSAIVIYGLANYYSLKKTTLVIAKDRLSSLTSQFSSAFGTAAQTEVRISLKAGRQNAVLQFLKTGKEEFRPQALSELDNLSRDSSWSSMELLDANGAPVLRSGKSRLKVRLSIPEVLSSLKLAPDSGEVGKLYAVRDSIFYPIVASIAENKHIIGYIFSWRIVQSSKKTIAQFSQLVGTGGMIYFGNNDGSLWTNTIKSIQGLPFKPGSKNEFAEYENSEGRQMIASIKPVASSKWLVAVEFPQQAVLKGVNDFTVLIIIAGAALMAVGIFAVWLMSRNITRPLNLLTIAAKAISEGNYTAPKFIEVYRDDELGELANAFNTMTAEVYHVWQNLDHKVKERTSQLERVNKELEAFSYSVSHDLRTPLRAVSGYSIMLKEDYDDKLDAEGKRIIGNIITNARMMGQLIDDLLTFSRLGKKELTSTKIDMQMLAISVVNELLQNDLEKDYKINIGILPPIEADPGMIKQALMNLASNAIKYSSKKAKPEIEIGSEDEETRTIYYVKDNGVGFDMAYSGKLFGVFQRLHSQEEFEGTGVGLALVKRIIDKHNGEVWAEGQENIGATFYFSLPKKIAL